MTTRLRFGIMCHGPFLSRWESKCVEQILALPNPPELVLLIVDKKTGAPIPVPQTLLGKLKLIGPGRVLFYLYCRYLHRPKSHETIPMGSWADGVPRIECTPRVEGKYSQYFSPEDMERIRESRLDFVLRFAFNIIRGEILTAPTHGVWSYHHDDEEKYRGHPACFWEIYKKDPVTGAILQRLTDRLDGGIVLKKGYFKTHDISHDENLDRVLFESSHWAAEVCSDIARGNASYLLATPSRTNAPIYTAPTNFQMLRMAWRLLMNGLKWRLNLWGIRDRWTIGIADAPIQSFLTPGASPKIAYISHRKRNAFYADPFGVRRENEFVLLCEDYSYEENLGKFAAIRSRAGKIEITPLNFPSVGHLSYPYIFDYRGETFCIPESCGANEIALFRAVDFPSRWERVKTLVTNFPGVDSTVVQHEGWWWMFCTHKDRQPNANLFVFFAQELTGTWLPHPGNPVKRDVRSSRPGGTPFVHEGKLYRPTQDCSRTYGGRVAINRVDLLTRTQFAESTRAYVEPPMGRQFRHGIHTLSSLGNQTILDGKRTVILPEAFTEHFQSRFGARKAA